MPDKMTKAQAFGRATEILAIAMNRGVRLYTFAGYYSCFEVDIYDDAQAVSAIIKMTHNEPVEFSALPREQYCQKFRFDFDADEPTTPANA